MQLLKQGDNAPVLITKDLYGKEYKTGKNDNWTFLSFHRFSACPFCNTRTHELKMAYPKFKEQNIEIYSIWPSTAESMKEYINNDQGSFPLIPDKQQILFEAYVVTHRSAVSALRLLAKPLLMTKAMKNTKKNMRIDGVVDLHPANFLVNPDGVIVLAHYGKHYADHLPLQEIFAARNTFA
ncbi:MAG: redoxin domain-containing protein [Chitinophagaceae bacterium]|nr:redoxin domain-containing protein [Chitinophagaceae bacterium]MCB9047333.1 redoxin domain-containing protein [Chitinophagales bacterium]